MLAAAGECGFTGTGAEGFVFVTGRQAATQDAADQAGLPTPD